MLMLLCHQNVLQKQRKGFLALVTPEVSKSNFIVGPTCFGLWPSSGLCKWVKMRVTPPL